LFLSDAVVMTPIAIAQSNPKTAGQIITMDVMEQKNWWQLEEVTKHCLDNYLEWVAVDCWKVVKSEAWWPRG
jgi:hypothetical protein